MRLNAENKRGFVLIAVIGVSAVLLIIVASVAAVVNQTSRSNTTYDKKVDCMRAVDSLIGGVIADGSYNLTREFPDKNGECTFEMHRLEQGDAIYDALTIAPKEGDLLIDVRATPRIAGELSPAQALNIEIFARANATSGKGYIVLNATRGPAKTADEN